MLERSGFKNVVLDMKENMFLVMEFMRWEQQEWEMIQRHQCP